MALRLVTPTSAPTSHIRLSELLGALSHALDVTEGQPIGHCVRSTFIAMAIGRRMGLPPAQLWELFYTAMPKDLGCSSNAARICDLYLADDIGFKRDFKTVGTSLPQVLGFVFSHTGRKSAMSDRLRAILNIMRNGGEIARDLMRKRPAGGVARLAGHARMPASNGSPSA